MKDAVSASWANLVDMDLSTDLSWRKLCTQIFCDLRAYLMGQTGPVSTDAAV